MSTTIFIPFEVKIFCYYLSILRMRGKNKTPKPKPFSLLCYTNVLGNLLLREESSGLGRMHSGQPQPAQPTSREVNISVFLSHSCYSSQKKKRFKQYLRPCVTAPGNLFASAISRLFVSAFSRYLDCLQQVFNERRELECSC